MPKTITLDFLASQFVDQKVTADAFISQLVAEKRAQELAYDRWFRDKVMNGIAEADAGDFATPEEVEATLRRWR
jgi:predicted transcriptional regulator